MFATLHGAFGTWPSDSSHRRPGEPGFLSGSGLNERLDFGEEAETIPAAATVFMLKPEHYPTGKVFIPPYFVPPGGDVIQRNRQDAPAPLLEQNVHGFAPELDQLMHESFDPANSQTNAGPARRLAPKPLELHFDHPGPNLVPPQYPTTNFGQNAPDRSQSPEPVTINIEQEREAKWSSAARQTFHTMIHDPAYVNRYRLSQEKYSRLVSYLRNPEEELLCDDGSKDHQTRYQAAHWTVKDGKLYKKAENKGTGRVRRHLDLDETWDVLTAEHLRSGHLGRDRLRKILERKYIGYTLQEIMFVLRECKRCNGGGGDKSVGRAPVELIESLDQNPEPADSGEMDEDATSPTYDLKQSSNFMMF